MLYLITIQQNRYDCYIYSLFETHTESVFRVTDKIVKSLIIDHGMTGKNISIDGNAINVKNWPHSIATLSSSHSEMRSPYILLSKISEQRFKMINGMDMVEYLDSSQLKQLIASGSVANCSFNVTNTQEK